MSAQGLMLWETGGSTETLFVEATQEQEGGDGGTLNCQRASLQIIELPASAEWIHVDNGATNSQTTDLAGTTTWYKSPLSPSTYRADGNSRLSAWTARTMACRTTRAAACQSSPSVG